VRRFRRRHLSFVERRSARASDASCLQKPSATSGEQLFFLEKITFARGAAK